MGRRRLLWMVLLGAGLAPATAYGDAVVATLAGPTAVRAWAGTAVLSVLDVGSGQYRLAVERAGAAPQLIPGVASAATAFDADIGPGPDGGAIIVYARCAGAICHVFRTTPEGGAETPIAGATSRDGSETAPTVWRDRLAFARTYARGSARVYLRRLDAPPSVRSTRLPGVPRAVCEELERRCRAITDGKVPELELRGTSLAESVTFGLRTEGICGERQVRLVDVATGRDLLVADTICGLGGQTWVGLSWAGPRLLFARTCPGDPGGCRHSNAIAYRYTPRTRRTETAPQPDVLIGFAAVDATHALEVRAALGPNGTCDNYDPDQARPMCSLTAAGPLAFQPVPSRHHR